MTRLVGRRLVATLVGAGLPIAVVGVLIAYHTRRPNVIVVVADTLRADRLGVYGNPRGLTPFLDTLAARGTIFTKAYATSSWTCPSVASLFTSRYPSQHHVVAYDARLPEAEVTVAERLRDARYVTVGFTANWRLNDALGYAQGFAWFQPLLWHGKVTADRVGRKSIRWLEKTGRRWRDRIRHPWRRPFFLYYHLMETHAPYDPERESSDEREVPLRRHLGLTAEDGARAAALNALLTPFRWHQLGPADVSFLESLYDAEVALLDRRLERLFGELERRGLLEGAVIVFTSDHGEEFRDHGEFLHGTSLFNELIHVPLIIVRADQPGGQVVDENVSLVDVAPTLLDVLGLPPEPRFEGRSLVPLIAGGRQPADVLVELLPTSRDFDLSRHRMAFLRGPLKLIVPRDGTAPEPVLYDLAADPWETEPDPPPLAADKGVYYEAARRAVTALDSRAGVAERTAVDKRTRERLRALGYAN